MSKIPSDHVLHGFAKDLGVPLEVFADCWRHDYREWATVADQWLRKNDKGFCYVPGTPPPDPTGLKTVAAIREHCGKTRAMLCHCPADDKLAYLWGRETVTTAIRALRELDQEVPEVAEPADLSQALTVMDRLVTYCHALAKREPPEAATTAASEAPDGEPPEVGFETLAQVLLDDNSARIANVARDTTKSADQRMEEIARLDPRFKARKSPDWASLLDVTSPAIRKTDAWARFQAEQRPD